MVQMNNNSKKKRRTVTITVLVAIPLLSVVLFYWSVQNLQTESIVISTNIHNDNLISTSAALKNNVIESTKLPRSPSSEPPPIKKKDEINISSCEKSPWKSSESLVGSCPGAMKPYKREVKISVEGCAEECCESDTCISWQYRKDTGCLHGGDVRLGMEKDGISSWCSDHPPKKWNGQYVLKRDGKGGIAANRDETGACNADTWNPNEQPGQCFGLGDVRNADASKSAQSCMEACCADSNCGAWQWQQDLGCFYNERMHGCIDSSDPIVFEPYVGRRKFQSTRKYVDNAGQPWSQAPQ